MFHGSKTFSSNSRANWQHLTVVSLIARDQRSTQPKIQSRLYWNVKFFHVRSAGRSSEMLARCVNENCNRPLHSFSEGRLFQFEVVSISLAATDENSAPFDEKPQRETVHFWLCGRCAATSTLVLEPARGLKLISVDEASLEVSDQTAVTSDVLRVKRC
jgi:hypothetical protein